MISITFTFMCFCGKWCVCHTTLVEIRKHLSGVSSLFLPCGSCRWNFVVRQNGKHLCTQDVTSLAHCTFGFTNTDTTSTTRHHMRSWRFIDNNCIFPFVKVSGYFWECLLLSWVLVSELRSSILEQVPLPIEPSCQFFLFLFLRWELTLLKLALNSNFNDSYRLGLLQS